MSAEVGRFPSVIVGVDGTPSGLRAAAWAAGEARSRGVGLRIVHAAPYARDPAGRRRAGAIVARAHAVAAQIAPDIAVETTVSTEHTVPALVGAAGPDDLLVVGTAGTRIGEIRLGSVASAVTAAAVHEGTCPVVVARVGGSSKGPVLIGLDLAQPLDALDGDGEAVAFGLAAADRTGVDVRILHAGGRDDVALRVALRPWLASHPGVEVALATLSGTPDVALLEASVGASLLVVGSRAHGRLVDALVGSVSRAAIHDAHCPVAVVPRRGRRPASDLPRDAAAHVGAAGPGAQR